MIQAIDLSEHNTSRGPIDFAQVRASGVEAVMLRIGWAGYDGTITQDSSLGENIEKASAAGLDVGLYLYTYTNGPQAAQTAAKQAVAIADQYAGKITYPIAFDVEETRLTSLTDQGREGLTNTVAAFCNQVKELGYYAMFYTYTSFALEHLSMAGLAQYDLWIADYRGDEALMQKALGRAYGIWQVEGQTGTCPGVTGPCDRDQVYKDYPALIRAAGLNRLEPEKVEPPDHRTVSRAELLQLLEQQGEPAWLTESLTGFTDWLQEEFGITGVTWG